MKLLVGVVLLEVILANIRLANIRLGLISVHCSELRGVRFSENQNYCISSMVKSIGGK